MNPVPVYESPREFSRENISSAKDTTPTLKMVTFIEFDCIVILIKCDGAIVAILPSQSPSGIPKPHSSSKVSKKYVYHQPHLPEDLFGYIGVVRFDLFPPYAFD